MTSTATIQDIIRDTIADDPEAEAIDDALASRESLQRVLERVRYPKDDTANNVPPLFKNPSTIFHSNGKENDHFFKVLFAGERFYRGQAFNNLGEGYVLFAFDARIRLLRLHTLWMADGTFSRCPKGYKQLY